MLVDLNNTHIRRIVVLRTNGQSEMGRVSDGELQRQHNGLKKLIRGSKFSSSKRKELEVELCYLQREMFIRGARKAAHEQYIEDQRGRRRYRNS